MKKDENFYYKVFEIVALIPFGKVTTYGSIAKAIGLRSSARLVGTALRSAADHADLPYHRVVNRNGELTGKHSFPTPDYMKNALLAEGITFKGDAVDMSIHFWEVDLIK